MERIVEKREAHVQNSFKRKRTAAYARVSSGKEAMLESLAVQVDYYSGYIRNNPIWEYAGVYADEARTGTKDERPEFQRLLSDCRAGKIDLVITKSISRFARNTLTLLETVRELKGLGVDVYFERENIHSLSADGELMLTILASFAQEESRSVSENCKWRIKKQFEQGIQPMWLKKLYGYRRTEDGGFVIQNDEAEVIKSIFERYIQGAGIQTIARELNQRQTPSPTGGEWNIYEIRYILRNEKYIGDLKLQKTFVCDHLLKKKIENKGEQNAYYVEGNHEGIVTKEQFRQVQRLLSERAKANAKKNRDGVYPFTGMLRCMKCGNTYRRKLNHCSDEYRRAFWNCRTYLSKGKAVCHTKQIPEEELERMVAEVCNIPFFDETVFRKKVREIQVSEWNKVVFIMQDGSSVEKCWENKSRKWTDEMKAKNFDNLRRGHKNK